MTLMHMLQILVSLLLGSAIFLLVVSVFSFPVKSEPPIHRRLAASVGIRRDTIFENPYVAPLLSLFLTVAHRFQISSLRERIRRDLNATGNPSGYSVEEYLAICMGMSVLFFIASCIMEVLMEGSQLFLWGPIALVVGFYIPLMALRTEAERRLVRIRKQLPYTLDLISLTMAAGSSFPEAVLALIRDNPDDDLNQELAVAMREIEFGTPRAQALTDMGQRIPLESLRSIVGAVNQADVLGSPMSKILKLQSEMLRQQRSVRAEKLAASASLRILIPSMLIMMAVVIVVFAPMVIAYIQRGSLW